MKGPEWQFIFQISMGNLVNKKFCTICRGSYIPQDVGSMANAAEKIEHILQHVTLGSDHYALLLGQTTSLFVCPQTSWCVFLCSIKGLYI